MKHTPYILQMSLYENVYLKTRKQTSNNHTSNIAVTNHLPNFLTSVSSYNNGCSVLGIDTSHNFFPLEYQGQITVILSYLTGIIT
jgi:hypothetical protein